MDEIGKRIMTRKLVLILYYRFCFFARFQFLDLEVFKDIVLVSNDLELWKDKEELRQYLNEIFETVKNEDLFEESEYYINYFFSFDKIDFEFLKNFLKDLEANYNSVRKEVNKVAKSFEFENMDLIDQALFMLGYVEFFKIGNKKSTVINEVIELSKRYGDYGSGKLLNGILDKILIG